MAALDIRVGTHSFRKLRMEKCCYIDKTNFLRKLLAPGRDEVTLITRPRRFGKSLTMSMLAEFFDISKDSRNLFEGLEIAEDKSLCDVWMNKFPVLSISLKPVEGKTFIDAFNRFKLLSLRLCEDHNYLLESPKIPISTKKIMMKVMDGTANEYELADILFTLCRALQMHHEKAVIVLVDEYDVPLNKAWENNFYEEMANFFRALLGSVLKDNDSLMFAVLTGCLRFSRESIFTGLNNFSCYGIDDFAFSDCFGFTESEVEKLLADSGLSGKMDEVKAWYDGYRFGESKEIYCPWDVLQYVRDLLKSPRSQPKAYWRNSSSNEIVANLLARAGTRTRNMVETLVNGGNIEVKLCDSITYDTLYSSEDNVWIMFYLTGYLTRVCGEAAPLQDTKKVRLGIPNRELCEIFTENIQALFEKNMSHRDRHSLFEAFWNADEQTFTRQISDLLMGTISYHNFNESFYQGFITGIFQYDDFDVKTDKESGLGRPDILVRDLVRKRAAIIEMKRARSMAEMEMLAQKAFDQISSRQYDATLRMEGRETVIIHWVLVTFGKTCVAKSRPGCRTLP